MGTHGTCCIHYLACTVVVVGGANGKNIHYSISVDDSGDSVNTTSIAIDDDTFGNENSMDTGPFAQSIEDIEHDRSMRLELSNGDNYECLVVHQPLKRKELFHHVW